MLSPGAIVDPEDLRVPGEQPGTPIVVIDDLGEQAHGHRFRARQGKNLLLITVLSPEVTMQRELRDLLSHRVVQAEQIVHPNLLPTYGAVRLPLGDEGFDTLFVVRPDPGCPTLRAWLHEVWQAGHTLDPLNAVAIVVQVCEALAALHERCAHGFVTVDNVFMYPTGGMPQALLSGAGEGVVLPYAPGFDRYAQAGYLPMAGRELYEAPHEPRVETDVLGAAALVLEILTGQPLEPGMPLERFGLPSRLERILEVASQANPDDRPQDILMFSRRLQAAVGLGDDPVEPSAVLEPVHHGEHADPRYPAVRAKPWRPPPPPAPPWAEDAGPTQGSGAWNVGAPTPGSGAWNIGGPTPGSGAWNQPAPPRPTPGSGAWNQPVPPRPAPPRSPGSGAWNQPAPPPTPGSGPWNPPAPPAAGRPPNWSGSSNVAHPPRPAPPGPVDRPPASGPSLGRDFPMLDEPELEDDDLLAKPKPPSSTPRQEGRTKLFGAAPAPPPPGQRPPSGSMPSAPPPPPISAAPPPPPSSAPAPSPRSDPAQLAKPAPINFEGSSPAPLPFGAPGGSVSIVMPAPDGSMMAPLGKGPRDYMIERKGKSYGPYDLAQLEQLIPMGKLRSVDAVKVISLNDTILAVDLPGLRPLFEAKAREQDLSRVGPLPTAPVAATAPSPAPDSRGKLWLIIGVLAAALLAGVAFMALS